MRVESETRSEPRSREGLIQGWEGDLQMGIAGNLQGLVRTRSRGGELVPVGRLIGASDALAGIMRPLLPFVIAEYEEAAATVRVKLGEEPFAAAREAGRALSLEATVAEAVALADELT